MTAVPHLAGRPTRVPATGKEAFAHLRPRKDTPSSPRSSSAIVSRYGGSGELADRPQGVAGMAGCEDPIECRRNLRTRNVRYAFGYRSPGISAARRLLRLLFTR